MKIKTLLLTALVVFTIIPLASAQDGAIGAGGVSVGGGGGSSSGGTMPITGSGNTITTDIPLIDGTETWNNSGQSFSAIRINITNTASAATSTLLKLQVAAADIFSVDKTGVVQFGASKSKLSSAADGDLTFTTAAGGNPTQIKFGGAVYLRVEGNGLAIYNPSLASYYDLNAGIITTTGVVDSTGIVKARGGLALGNNTSPTLSGATPTITSGFGTTPTISNSTSGGSFVFRVTVGSGGIATSGILGFGTVTTGWNCFVSDLTGGIATRQTASTTSSVTITGASAWAASSVLIFHCAAF